MHQLDWLRRSLQKRFVLSQVRKPGPGAPRFRTKSQSWDVGHPPSFDFEKVRYLPTIETEQINEGVFSW